MNINAGDLVLEVGSGDKPYPRSDVLLDKYFSNSGEREAKKPLVIDRPFVIGDVECLPFRKKSFDYIIASHVLEHAQDPHKFLDELMRVGKSGYIETPLPLRERINDWSFHRWYVFLRGGKLTLIKKTRKSRTFYSTLPLAKRKQYRILEGKKLLNLKFEWQQRINYEILEKEPDTYLEKLDQELVSLESYLKTVELSTKQLHPVQWLKDRLFPIKFGLERKIEALGRNKNIDLLSLVVCPRCKKDLEVRLNTLRCRKCQLTFPFKKSLPIFI